MAYATAADLTAWLPANTAPSADEAARLLDRASDLIDEYAVAGWALQVGSDTLPADQVVADALRDAVCAQVEQWLSVGEDNAVDGYPGSTAVQSGPSTGRLVVSHRPSELAPRARRALQKAGLTQARGW